MALVYEEAKATIIEFCNSKAKTKSKFYFNDFTALFPDEKGRDVKKILTQMINEEVLVFWSSGSTSMYGLAGAGKHAEGED
ncbi:MAG: dissimilatory sulfite reductase D family protein [Humidesulfovibrio sp.]|nr:dissimilatory sulfite reductase D family protein [Humidesulfovibrio sp.]